VQAVSACRGGEEARPGQAAGPQPPPTVAADEADAAACALLTTAPPRWPPAKRSVRAGTTDGVGWGLERRRLGTSRLSAAASGPPSREKRPPQWKGPLELLATEPTWGHTITNQIATFLLSRTLTQSHRHLCTHGRRRVLLYFEGRRSNLKSSTILRFHRAPPALLSRLLKPALLGLSITSGPEKPSCDVLKF